MSKVEDKLSSILDNRDDAMMKKVNERFVTIFIAGLLAGLVLAYTNVFSYMVGLGTGLVIASNFTYVSSSFSSVATTVLEKSLTFYKKQLSQN